MFLIYLFVYFLDANLPGTFLFLQNFVQPKRPFRRMEYVDAIKYLKEHEIYKDDGTPYEFGEVRICITFQKF